MTYQPTEDELDLLVAYALDIIEPEEMVRVLNLLEIQPSLSMLLAELRATSAFLPYGLPDGAPAPDLRARVLAHAIGAARPAPPVRASRGNRLATWFGVLSGALALALVLLGAQLGNLTTELARARETIAALSADRSDLTRVLASASSVSELSGAAGEGRLIRAADGSMLLAVRLPPSQPDRVYQLWLIDGGAPVSAAVFRVESGETVLIPVPRPILGTTAAITEEPSGGSPAPTTPILITGELG
jgi:anti-sigma-K factor RskA